jgi:hypothetical protein
MLAACSEHQASNVTNTARKRDTRLYLESRLTILYRIDFSLHQNWCFMTQCVK